MPPTLRKGKVDFFDPNHHARFDAFYYLGMDILAVWPNQRPIRQVLNNPQPIY